MGVGSQRAAAEGISKESYSVINDYDIPLVIGNVGAPQLVEQKKKHALEADDVMGLMELISADYMAIHLNFLQESVQPEGDMNGKGCLEAIRDLAKEIPIIVKETGAGISHDTAERLNGIGVRAIDIGGMGGTSFSAIEMYRAIEKNDRTKSRLGRTFFDWGIPSPVSLWQCRDCGLPLIASGGVLDGIHVAAAIAMGASSAGVANIILKEATQSAEAVIEKLTIIREELRAAMLLTGCRDLSQLAKAKHVVLGETKQWMDQL